MVRDAWYMLSHILMIPSVEYFDQRILFRLFTGHWSSVFHLTVILLDFISLDSNFRGPLSFNMYRFVYFLVILCTFAGSFFRFFLSISLFVRSYSIQMTENMVSESSCQFGIHGAFAIPNSCTMYIVHIHCMWDAISNRLIWWIVYFVFVMEPISVWVCRHSSSNQSLSYIMCILVMFFFSLSFCSNWTKCSKRLSLVVQSFRFELHSIKSFHKRYSLFRILCISVGLSKLFFDVDFRFCFPLFSCLLQLKLDAFAIVIIVIGFWTG